MLLMKPILLLIRSMMLVAIFTVATQAAGADAEVAAQQTMVLDCVARMEVQTTWDQCRTLMFQPCQTDTVGSSEHLSCLTELRQSWGARMQSTFRAVLDRVSDDGKRSLDELLAQWSGYVVQKCADVGKAKASISEEAARLGCETSETIGLVAELDACLDGRSTAPYCDSES